jgi:hypothetical protein
VDVPDTNALVERASCDELGVGRDGNRGDTILDSEGESVGALLDVPETDGSVTRA